MTREEAIRQIENRWSIMDYCESEALGEALDMAIEALHREEAEEKGYCHRINYTPKPCENANCDCVEVVRCKDCRYLDVWNLKNIYAVCAKHGITFESFEDDTRTCFCSWGERREP